MYTQLITSSCVARVPLDLLFVSCPGCFSLDSNASFMQCSLLHNKSFEKPSDLVSQQGHPLFSRVNPSGGQLYTKVPEIVLLSTGIRKHNHRLQSHYLE